LLKLSILESELPTSQSPLWREYWAVAVVDDDNDKAEMTSTTLYILLVPLNHWYPWSHAVIFRTHFLLSNHVSSLSLMLLLLPNHSLILPFYAHDFLSYFFFSLPARGLFTPFTPISQIHSFHSFHSELYVLLYFFYYISL